MMHVNDLLGTYVLDDEGLEADTSPGPFDDTPPWGAVLDNADAWAARMVLR